MSYLPKSSLQALLSGVEGPGLGAITWEEVGEKPSAFTPTSHNHSFAQVPGLQDALNAKQPTGPYLTSVSWGEVSGKPATFAPSTHSHAIGDVAGLQGALDGKQVAGSYADQAHSHTIANVTGLQTALDGKQAAGTYLTSVPTHSLDLTTDSSTRLAMTAGERSKLLGIGANATANATDAQLRDRSTHTGTQVASTITGLATVATSGSYNDLLNKPTSSGSDPWTVVKIAADYTNATVTFANVTDGTTALTFTPPANTDWELEGRILIETTTIANLPRVGVLIVAGAARGYGAVNLWQAGATAAASVHANGGWRDANGVTVVQIAAGGVLAANVPYECEVIMSGRSGATPTAISIQMAAETAAANVCFVKRGSFIRYRTV